MNISINLSMVKDIWVVIKIHKTEISQLISLPDVTEVEVLATKRNALSWPKKKVTSMQVFK